MNNSSDFENSVFYYSNENGTFLQLWVVVVFFTFLLIGTFLNFVIVLVLIHSKRNGILSTILQLAVCDVMTTYVAVMEIWALNHHSWCFSEDLCSFFLGSETLFNTLTLYLTICLNFHVISQSNLHSLEIQRSNKNPLTSSKDEDDYESNRNLIGSYTNRTSSYRNLTINYQNKRSSISMVFPSLLTWFVAFSISIPQFSLTSAVKIKNHSTMCTFINIYFNKLLQYLLFLFRIVIPVPLLLILMIILTFIYVRYRNLKNDGEISILDKKTEAIKSFILFAIILSVICVLCNSPRQFISALHLYEQKFEGDNIVGFKMGPLENVFVSYFTLTLTGIFYYCSTVLRSILYFLMLPDLKNLFRFEVIFCTKKK